MRAKSFFYACGGILMLVAAYQLGVHQAEAQGSFIRYVGGSSTNLFAIDNQGTIRSIRSEAGSVWQPPFQAPVEGMPGLLAASGSGIVWMVYPDGNTWVGGQAGWTNMPNFFGTTTNTPNVDTKTWTETKQEYRED